VYTGPDPIGEAGGCNPFTYVGDAWNWLDPWGLNTLPSLPSSTVVSDGVISIAHHYDSPIEHANPIHFHVEQGGKDLGKIKADGTILKDSGLSKNKNFKKLIAESKTVSALRKAERKIANYLKKTGAKPGGQAFLPGKRGLGCK